MLNRTATALKTARDDLAAYCAAQYRGFKLPSHLAALVKVLEDVERGDLDRVIILMPPRSG